MRSLRTIIVVVCTLGLIVGVVKLGYERAAYQRDWVARVIPWKVAVEPDAFFDAFTQGDRFKRSDRLSAVQGHRDVLKILGWSPTLPSVERLYTSDVPGWSWWNRAENRRNQLLMEAQAMVMPAGADGLLHVNAARDTAVVKSRVLVTMMRADISGLRETALLPAALAEKIDR